MRQNLLIGFGGTTHIEYNAGCDRQSIKNGINILAGGARKIDVVDAVVKPVDGGMREILISSGTAHNCCSKGPTTAKHTQSQLRAGGTGTEAHTRLGATPLWRPTDKRFRRLQVRHRGSAIDQCDDVASGEFLYSSSSHDNLVFYHLNLERRVQRFMFAATSRPHVSVGYSSSQPLQRQNVFTQSPIIHRVRQGDIKFGVPVHRNDIPVRPEVLNNIPYHNH